MYGITKHTVVIFSACVLSLGITACGRETPEKTQTDISNAQMKGAKDVAKERDAAAANTMDAQKDVNKANAELGHEEAKGNHDVVIAQAEAAHKISIEKCEAMTGDARSSCKKQADLNLEQAKLQADSTERAMDPKH